MRKYGTIPCEFWIEAREKQLSDDGRQLMAYLMTCHHGNNIGCFRMPVAYIADDLNWDHERVSQTLYETVSKGFLERDNERSWNRLPNHFETVSIANPNMAKGMEPFIEAVPKDSPIFNNLVDSLRPYAKRFRNGYLNGLVNGLVNGFETEAAASSCSNTDLFTNKPSEQVAARDAVDNSKPELNFNDFDVASVAIAKAVHRRSLTAADKSTLLEWCAKHDIQRVVLPWLENRVANYLEKHGSMPANPLSYFHSGLNEHLAKVGIK